MQWTATAFLWSQWLIQDLANIFVYLPRTAELHVLIFAAVVMLVLHAVIFKNRGGRIQGIVTSKTNTTDIRTATLIDFIYATILLYFKEMSNIPMSTTWVFLGLLAGRELALAFRLRHRTISESILLAGKDVGKAAIGLAGQRRAGDRSAHPGPQSATGLFRFRDRIGTTGRSVRGRSPARRRRHTHRGRNRPSVNPKIW